MMKPVLDLLALVFLVSAGRGHVVLKIAHRIYALRMVDDSTRRGEVVFSGLPFELQSSEVMKSTGPLRVYRLVEL